MPADGRPRRPDQLVFTRWDGRHLDFHPHQRMSANGGDFLVNAGPAAKSESRSRAWLSIQGNA